jgi:sigma-B regulation protein RsbU (phosphoserine phosphatase)
MIDTIIHTAVNLLKDVGVVVVVAYLVTRTDAYARVLDRRASFRDRLLLTLIFGLFSIWGTVSGSEMLGATANTRDLGPTMGGLAAGPFVGIGAGVIGAVQRLAMGGVTCVPCSLATFFIGAAAGAVYELNRRRFIGVVGAVVFMALAETFHMGLVFLLVHPFSEALEIVTAVYPPMLLSNCAGVAVFALIFANRERERTTAAAKARIDSEIATARAIQRGLLPRTDDLGLGDAAAAALSVAACLEPARDVGGDLYDLFALDDDRLCLVIGDVAGKGVAAGLFMSAADALVHAASMTGRPVDMILEIVNKELWRRNDTLMFVTLFIGVVRLSTGELQYASAGHCPPLVRRRAGGVAMLPSVRGAVLAVDPDLTFEVGTERLAAGDVLLLYTDGVTEATDAAGGLFGEERLGLSLEAIGDASPDEAVERIMGDVGRFVGEAEQFDDIAMVVFRYEGKAGAGREACACRRASKRPRGWLSWSKLSPVARTSDPRSPTISRWRPRKPSPTSCATACGARRSRGSMCT